MEYLKKVTVLPVQELRLTELVNITCHKVPLPFFVFELKGNYELKNNLFWADEKIFTTKLSEVNVEGSPLF